MADIATLGLSINSSQAAKGAKDLDALTNSARKTEGAAGTLMRAFDRIDGALGRLESAVNAVERAILGLGKNSGTAERSVTSFGVASGRASGYLQKLSVAGANVSVTFSRMEGAAAGAAAAVTHQDAATNRAAAAARDHAAALSTETVAATKAEASVRRLNVAANQNARSMKGGYVPTANLAAQFQDIGVQAAMGANAMQIALAQGTQISLAFGDMGAAGAVKALGGAFKSVFSPLALATVAIVALVAAGLQMVNWPAAAAGALNLLASALDAIGPYAIAAAATMALLYAPAIIAGLTAVSELILGLTARLAGMAIGFTSAWLAAIGPAGWFILGLAAIATAMIVFRDNLTSIFGTDIVGVAKSAINAVIGAFVGGFNGIMAAWGQLPSAMGDVAVQAANRVLQVMQTMLHNLIVKINGAMAAIAGMVKGSPFEFKAPQIGPGALGAFGSWKMDNPFGGAAANVGKTIFAAIAKSQNVDWLGKIGQRISSLTSSVADKLRGLASGIGAGDAAKKKGGKSEADKQADKYDKITQSAQNYIASQNAAQAAIGMTDLEAAKLTHTQDLLNRATQAGIALTPQRVAELTKLGGAMGAAEIATKRMKDAYATVKDAVKGFLSTFTSAIEQGKGLWQAFGAAAKSVLDKIIDKIEDQLSTAITNALFSGGKSASGGGGGLFGGIFGAIGSLFGFAGGGYTGRGAASSVAGVVHGGEYVFSKRATDRIGVGNLDAIHSRARGYANGGHVATLPRVQASANDRGSGGMNINVTVNGARGNQEIQTMVASGVREGLSKYDKNLPNRLNQYNERGI